MKLHIRKNQKENKGIFGGHKGMNFLLNCQVVLSTEENELIARYRAENEPLTYTTVAGDKVPELKIGDLVRGVSYEVRDVTELLNREEIVKNACESFKNLLLVMNSFGGEEVIEF
jgi:hypothetical protein